MMLFLPSFRAVEDSGNIDGPCRSLWVGNINPEEVSERHLIQLFSRCGRVDNVRILPKRFCAFVNYEKAESATLALEKLQVRKYLALLIQYPDLGTEKDSLIQKISRIVCLC